MSHQGSPTHEQGKSCNSQSEGTKLQTCFPRAALGVSLLLLLLLSRFSHVRLLATPWTAAHQAPLSMEFSRQEYWSGVPLPSPYIVTAAAAKSLQSCPTLCDPRDGSRPGSAVPGILQARTPEWVAISFSIPLVNLKFIFLLENFMQEFMLPSVLSVKVI